MQRCLLSVVMFAVCSNVRLRSEFANKVMFASPVTFGNIVKFVGAVH